ncbi:CGP-CTERM sorting domain-containing protein [Thermococcus prieurii]
MSPVEVPNVPIEWTSVKVGNLTVSYPAEFLGFSNNHTVIILNGKISKVLPHVPFAVKVNGKFYPLFRSVNGTLLPVPPKVGPDLNCTSLTPSETSTARGENREICGPGAVLLLSVLALIFWKSSRR